MSFSGTNLYSYSEIIARAEMSKDYIIILVTSEYFSNTTNKHKAEILNTAFISFVVPDIYLEGKGNLTKHTENIKYFVNQAIHILTTLTRKRDIYWYMDRYSSILRELAKYLEVFNIDKYTSIINILETLTNYPKLQEGKLTKLDKLVYKKAVEKLVKAIPPKYKDI